MAESNGFTTKLWSTKQNQNESQRWFRKKCVSAINRILSDLQIYISLFGF